MEFSDKESKNIKKDDLRLIVSYSAKRAKKNKFNRERGLKRLKAQIKSGKLTKSNINNRGYNKYLIFDGNVKISLDEQKVEDD
ncbi:MAG: transposase, partial [Bacteroidetes bacterium]|nr:transposase [Bacteroidota bacterium]